MLDIIKFFINFLAICASMILLSDIVEMLPNGIVKTIGEVFLGIVSLCIFLGFFLWIWFGTKAK